ncbi:MAG: ABC transporter substrate-binding protein [Clostridiales bacterium]|nr:ABC transporter substrate-binding protein [Clostridiales bacterium]
MKRKLLALALCLSVTGAAFTACAKTDVNSVESETAAAETEAETAEETEAAEETAAETAAETEAAADEDTFSYPLTLTDAYGNEVTVEAEPETIVTVSPALTEIVYALGGEDKLIGRSEYDDYPEEVSEVQSVGAIDMPDTELIVSLDPDVVLASSIFSEEAYNALTDAGITVVIIKDETSLDALTTYVETVADVIGLHDAGEALAMEISDEIAEVADEASETIAGDGITVYYCMGYGEYGDYTAGGDTYINDIIEVAGCENAAADIEGWSISTEELLELDPYIILVPSWGYDAFLETEPYTELTAVQEGRVLSVDPNLFERIGPRNVDAVRTVYEYALDANAVAHAGA